MRSRESAWYLLLLESMVMDSITVKSRYMRIFRWYHCMQDNFHKIKTKRTKALNEREKVYHETGRWKGCASVFLQKVSNVFPDKGRESSKTYSTYLSKSTTLGSLKSR